ncbi:MAG TPA: hypothetical protein PL002_10330, partial [Flavobacteriales bacterium]|nr:hypothetical protein [Flavobacteriales bacterium]
MNSRPYSTPPRRTWRWLRTGLFSGALALIAATISPTVHGQSVIIGTDAVSTAGTGSDPTDDFYTKMRYQTVYLASELTAGGVPAGSSITALGFSVIEDNGPAFPNYSVRLAHTTAVNAATHNAATLTTVFGPASVDWTVQGA